MQGKLSCLYTEQFCLLKLSLDLKCTLWQNATHAAPSPNKSWIIYGAYRLLHLCALTKKIYLHKKINPKKSVQINRNLRDHTVDTAIGVCCNNKNASLCTVGLKCCISSIRIAWIRSCIQPDITTGRTQHGSLCCQWEGTKYCIAQLFSPNFSVQLQ